jgi:hypothetical protein
VTFSPARSTLVEGGTHAGGKHVTERRNRWSVERVEPSVVDRLAAAHTPYSAAVEQAVDIISDPAPGRRRLQLDPAAVRP